ncbi:PadR family transcriptional regulator [Fructilactobacillus frigidiflavus]|uniref:PadR family transcriptional regulator n=1 Tax=Fructilactobacillus frigidiflavus TaxID=3242688 RepID=UPI0037582661
MKSDDIILGILSEKPATGYEIKEKFSSIFSNFYNASFGSIYPILHKLTDAGKVVFEIVEQTGKPNKKIYSITKSGRKAFAEYLQTPVEPKKIKSDFMVKLFYSADLSKNERETLINNEIKDQLNGIEELQALRKSLDLSEITKYQLFTLDLGIKQRKLLLEELKNLK